MTAPDTERDGLMPAACPCCNFEPFWSELTNTIMCPNCGLQTMPTRKDIAHRNWNRRAPTAQSEAQGEMLRTLEEARRACLACFHVIAANRDNNAAIFDELDEAFAKHSVKDGVTQRIAEIIASARSAGIEPAKD